MERIFPIFLSNEHFLDKKSKLPCLFSWQIGNVGSSPYIKKNLSMGAYKHMLELFPDLCIKAERYNYPESSICTLSGDFSRLKSEFPEIHENLISCSHHRDTRSPLEYGQDLVASWLFEDILMENLSSAGINISKAGTDKNRVVLPSQKVSSSSDCIISFNNIERFLEIMSDYTGYWSKNHKMELRDEKYLKMKKTNSLFLGISTSDNKYFLLDMSLDMESIYIPSHRFYGGKPAYSIKVPQEIMKELNFPAIAKDIINTYNQYLS